MTIIQLTTTCAVLFSASVLPPAHAAIDQGASESLVLFQGDVGASSCDPEAADSLTLLPGLLMPAETGDERQAIRPTSGGGQNPLVATFSIVAFDPANQSLGVAVQSKFFGVGTVVPWAKAKVGAVATQSYANIDYGREGLALLAAGDSARETLEKLTEMDPGRAKRQVGIVDAQGRVASFTGNECHPWAGHLEGTNFCVQGNILAGEPVITAMAQAYLEAQKKKPSELADWLVAALAAGQAAGGDKRGQQSAALLVVREGAGYSGKNDRFIDLRVEDHAHPIEELTRLLGIHKQFYGR